MTHVQISVCDTRRRAEAADLFDCLYLGGFVLISACMYVLLQDRVCLAEPSGIDRLRIVEFLQSLSLHRGD